MISVITENSTNDISLHAPSGLKRTEVMTRLSNGAIYIVDAPVDGNWKLRIPNTAGEYQYSVKISSNENIDFKHYYTKKFNKKILEFRDPLAGEWLFLTEFSYKEEKGRVLFIKNVRHVL